MSKCGRGRSEVHLITEMMSRLSVEIFAVLPEAFLFEVTVAKTSMQLVRTESEQQSYY